MHTTLATSIVTRCRCRLHNFQVYTLHEAVTENCHNISVVAICALAERNLYIYMRYLCHLVVVVTLVRSSAVALQSKAWNPAALCAAYPCVLRTVQRRLGFVKVFFFCRGSEQSPLQLPSTRPCCTNNKWLNTVCTGQSGSQNAYLVPKKQT